MTRYPTIFLWSSSVDDQTPSRVYEGVLLVGQLVSQPKLCFTADLQEIAPSFKYIKYPVHNTQIRLVKV
jgi:hypothetical protein